MKNHKTHQGEWSYKCPECWAEYLGTRPELASAMIEALAKEQRDTSHLSQSATDTATTYPKEVEAYWKSKEGRCLGCNAEIAVEDQYCPACHEFLNEVHQ